MAAEILVVGASGSVGSEVVRQLRVQGQTVRATTGKRAAAGGDTVFVDLASGEGVAQAFSGVQRAFMLSPAGYADQYAVLAPLVAAAREHGVRKVVMMTAFGVDANPDAPLRRAELALEQSGLDWNVIRPNWFMQNFNTFWQHGIVNENRIALPAGDAATSFIDTRDIGAVAAKLLLTDEHSGRAYNLTGPEALTHAQVAQAISEVSGRAVSYQEVAPQELAAGLRAAGLNDAYVELMLLLFSFVKAGYNAPLTPDVQQILGRAPTAFHSYARDYRAAWA